MDALNLLGKKYLLSRMTSQLLLLQEYNISLKHISGESNIFADTLSRLRRLDDVNPYDNINKIPSTNLYYAFNFLSKPEENKDFLLDLNYIRHEQLQDNKLSSIIKNISNFKNYTYLPINNFNRHNILQYNNKYVVPESL